MKKIAISFFLFVCAFTVRAQSFYGKKLKENKASVNASKLSENLADKSMLTIRVSGIVDDVCQAKGCWMTVLNENGNSMRVTFKDYAFFVPMDIAGKRVVFEGVATKKETSVAELRHYAQDAGKSASEIEKINKPEYAITFEAEGVIVEN